MSRMRRAAGVPVRPAFFALVLAVLLLSALGSAAPAAAEPRPLNEAERQAVELALLYLDQGPAAWWPRLAPDSPLRALGREAALDEIGVRAGPREGATWRLETPAPSAGEHVAVMAVELPSGADEVLELTFAPGGGLLSLTSLVEARELPEVALLPVQAAAPPPEEAAVRGRRRFDFDVFSNAPLAAGIWEMLVAEWVTIAVGILLLFALLAAVVVRIAFGGGAGRARLAPTEAFQRPSDGGEASPPPAERSQPPSRRPPSASAILLAASALAAGAVLACRGGEGAAEAPPAEAQPAASPAEDAPPAESAESATPALRPLVRLGALRPMREALGRGEPLPSPPPDLSGDAARAERLWYAERLLLEMDLDGAAAILDGFPAQSEVPLVERLRARMAVARNQRLDAPTAYELAIRLGPDHDGLRLELVEVLFTGGFMTEAQAEVEELVEIGTRNAGVYYLATMLAAAPERLDQAEDLLRTAWRMEPIERAELFGSPALAVVATRSRAFETLGLGQPGEPRVQPPFEGRRPLELPPGARAVLTGEMLRVAVGPGRVEVPGGWVLAPEMTPVEDAITARRNEVDELLAATVRGGLGGGRLLVNPGHLRQLLRAARALYREHRWAELEALTAMLGDDAARLPPELVRLRAVALLKLERDEEARRLMIGLARAEALGQRADPGSLYDLGELFAAGGQHDLAMKLIRRAGELSPYPLGGMRLRQIALDKELAESYLTHRSRHFELRYPKSASEEHVRQVAWVLEEELVRLQRWIPGAPKETIEVSLFPLADFISAFSGGIDVAGLYDGRVRVPFAHLPSLHPYLVSTLSHELAHALIDQRTGGRAPDWLQEGLAQHVEMVQNTINPIPDLASKQRVLALPVIDAALDGFSDPELVSLAYAQAAWTLHYVEARHGVAGIHRLLDAFAAGNDSDRALRQALGADLAAFDLGLREWCVEQAPATWPTRVRRYDQELDTQAVRGGGAVTPAAPVDPSARWTRRTPGSMEQWHARYQRRVAPFRRALGPAIERVRAGASAPAACAGLEDAAASLLADPGALTSPDPAPGRALRAAFEGFGRMAMACGAGDLLRARQELAAAERDLAQAAELLRPYGLKP